MDIQQKLWDSADGDTVESLRQRNSDLVTGLEACDEQVVALHQQLTTMTAQCEKVVRWKHLMSYNDSYFGEPAGDLKRVVYEIERSMPIKGQ